MQYWNKNTLTETQHCSGFSQDPALWKHLAVSFTGDGEVSPEAVLPSLSDLIAHAPNQLWWRSSSSESSQEQVNPCELHSLAKSAVWHSKLSTSFSSRTWNRFLLQSRDYFFGGCQYKASWRGVTVMTESCSKCGVRRLGWLRCSRNAVSSWPPHPREPSCMLHVCSMKRLASSMAS